MEMVAKIEELVCEAMDLELSGIINTNKADYRTARKFVWYILFAEMDYSGGYDEDSFKKRFRFIWGAEAEDFWWVTVILYILTVIKTRDI